MGHGEDRWVRLYSPRSHVELALLESVFIGDGLTYFLRNRHFGSLQVGPKIEWYNDWTFLVPAGELERGQELVDDYRESTSRPMDESRYRPRDRLRMLVEVLWFGWFVPGTSRRFLVDDTVAPPPRGGIAEERDSR